MSIILVLSQFNFKNSYIVNICLDLPKSYHFYYPQKLARYTILDLQLFSHYLMIIFQGRLAAIVASEMPFVSVVSTS